MNTQKINFIARLVYIYLHGYMNSTCFNNLKTFHDNETSSFYCQSFTNRFAFNVDVALHVKTIQSYYFLIFFPYALKPWKHLSFSEMRSAPCRQRCSWYSKDSKKLFHRGTNWGTCTEKAIVLAVIKLL